MQSRCVTRGRLLPGAAVRHCLHPSLAACFPRRDATSRGQKASIGRVCLQSTQSKCEGRGARFPPSFSSSSLSKVGQLLAKAAPERPLRTISPNTRPNRPLYATASKGVRCEPKRVRELRGLANTLVDMVTNTLSVMECVHRPKVV